MLHSPIHNARAVSTPSQRLAHLSRNMRQARIAAKAMVSEKPAAFSYEIPNTPYGIPKIGTRQLPPTEPVPVYRMWFEDLVAEAERVLTAKPIVLPPLKIEDIQRVVAAHFELPWKIMFTATRTARCVLPRQIAMYLAKTMTTRSFPDIGKRFGGRDHTTILYAVQKYRNLIETDEATANYIAAIKAKLALRFA